MRTLDHKRSKVWTCQNWSWWFKITMSKVWERKSIKFHFDELRSISQIIKSHFKKKFRMTNTLHFFYCVQSHCFDFWRKVSSFVTTKEQPLTFSTSHFGSKSLLWFGVNSIRWSNCRLVKSPPPRVQTVVFTTILFVQLWKTERKEQVLDLVC